MDTRTHHHAHRHRDHRRRPGRPRRATTCRSVASPSSSSTPTPASATTGAGSGTASSSTRPRTWTDYPDCRSRASLDLPGQGRRRRLPRDLRAHLQPAGAPRDPRAGAGRRGRRLLRHTDRGRFTCRNVVVATGTFGRTPNVPDVAAELDPAILQLHSSEYRRPGQISDGPVLVVGASHSGCDIAYELAETHPTILAGRDCGEIPRGWVAGCSGRSSRCCSSPGSTSSPGEPHARAS